MKLQPTTYARDGRSLKELTSALAAEGWDCHASPVEGGSICCGGCSATTPAADASVDSLSRVEGASDPGDEAVVVGVTCPECSSRNTLVLSYGPVASEADADVLLALPDPPAPADQVLD